MQHFVIQIPCLRPLPPSTPCLFPVSMSTSPLFLTAKHLNLRKFDSRELITNRRSVNHTFIRCMANPRRVKMVAKQIRRELSDMLLTDKVLQYAVLPEAALGADRYLSSLTTISDVEVSTDLQIVKVYVSVFGDERGKEVALTGLKSKAKYVRSELGRRMKLRLTPEIRFIEDESLERGSRVLAILDRIKDDNENKNSQSGASNNDGSSDQSDDDGDWEGDDPDDEGIIYVK